MLNRIIVGGHHFKSGLGALSHKRFVCTNISGSKTFRVIVTSLRIDRILATGLAIGRRKVEYSLLSGLVKLNGKVVTKKSIEVGAGDIVDRISPEKSNDSNFTFGRVRLLEIETNKTKKGNYKISLERSKILQIPREEYLEFFSRSS